MIGPKRRTSTSDGIDFHKSWDDSLSLSDKDLILTWVAEVGPERLAKIAASLIDASGGRGHPKKPDSGLMLRMAQLLIANPDRPIYSVAREVATPEVAAQRSIELENLTRKLDRDFRKEETKWILFAKMRPKADEPETLTVVGVEANRALSRIIDIMPEFISIWRVMLSEARKKGDDALRILKLFGPARAEASFVDAMHALEATGYCPLQSNRFTTMPRTMLDLIECDLDAFQLERRDGTATGHK